MEVTPSAFLLGQVKHICKDICPIPISIDINFRLLRFNNTPLVPLALSQLKYMCSALCWNLHNNITTLSRNKVFPDHYMSYPAHIQTPDPLLKGVS